MRKTNWLLLLVFGFSLLHESIQLLHQVPKAFGVSSRSGIVLALSSSTSAHLQLTGLLDHATTPTNNDTNTNTMVDILEYMESSTNTTLLAIEGTRSQSKRRLEAFSLHILRYNLTEQRGVELLERRYDLQDRASLEKLHSLFRSERMVTSSKDFPPPLPPVGEMGAVKLKRSFEETLLGHANKLRQHYNINATSNVDDEAEAIRAFLNTQRRNHSDSASESWLSYMTAARQRRKDSTAAAAAEEKLLIKEFLVWFRVQFPYFYSPCCCCQWKDNNEYLGLVFPSSEERPFKAGLTELILCSRCKQVSRFPRYNLARKVLEQRKGRCGEYSILVMRMLQQLGFDARWVVDWADHVWAEVRCNDGIWTHVDPCEASIDEPLIYQGWGKNATYIFAMSIEGAVEDVTSKYTTNFAASLERREKEGVTQIIVDEALEKARSILCPEKSSE